MKLRLTLRSCPPAQGADTQRHLATGQLVIGRSSEADWCLRDQEKVLSKRHCVVEFKGGVYIVIDTSTNGVFHNESDKPVGRGNSVVLSDGDRLRFGAFMIKADFVEDQPVVAASADPFLAVLRETDSRPDDPTEDVPGDDPFGTPGATGPIAWTRIPDDEDGDDEPLLPPRPTLDPFAAEADWQRRTPDWEPTTDAENDGGMETAAWRTPEVTGAVIPDDWEPEAADDGFGAERIGGEPFGDPEPAPPAPGADDPFVIPAPPAFGGSAAVIPAAIPAAIPDDWLGDDAGGDGDDGDGFGDGAPSANIPSETSADPAPGGPPAFTFAATPAGLPESGGDEMARLVAQAERAARSLGAAWPPPGCLDDGEAVARHMAALLNAARAALTAGGVAVDEFEDAYRRELSESVEWS